MTITQSSTETSRRGNIWVRELRGDYGGLYQGLYTGQRVFSSRQVPFQGGPRYFTKTIISPHQETTSAIFHTHIDVYAPGSASNKHAHMNSAVFYVLEGRGFDVHNGDRYDWEAGDVCIVENACVHQHFNADESAPARMLIIKAKPLFMFTRLLFQGGIEGTSTDPAPGFEEFVPEA